MKEALNGSDVDDWNCAIQEEFESLIKNHTWDLEDRPENCVTVGSRLVLRNKFNAEGNLEKRKARIVAQGYSQRPGIDFNETFAPVVRLGSVRMLMALAVEYDLTVHPDVTTAFLNGLLDEDVYMEVPKLFQEMVPAIIRKESLRAGHVDPDGTAWKMLQKMEQDNQVCLLRKFIYGLKQAGRQWYRRLDAELRLLGLVPLHSDVCVYIKNRNSQILIAAIYVDDFFLMSNDPTCISEFKESFRQKFEMKDLGRIKNCLGMEFKQGDGFLEMSQTGYIKAILKRFGMENSRPVSTPLDPGSKLRKIDQSEFEENETFPFRELIGCLMYLAVATRPDIAYAVNHLSQFNNSNGKDHWIAVKRILRYLRGTTKLVLRYEKNSKQLEGYVDSDWAGCPEDRRSYTGFAFLLAKGVVTWEARKQRTVPLSSTEAEYMGLTEAAKGAAYLLRFLAELGLGNQNIVPIYNGNQGAQKLAMNPVFHSRSKHIDIRYHFVRDALKEGKISVSYVPTSDMMADILTKGLSGPKHHKCLSSFGMGFSKSIKSA